jgi:hypothetical protein
MPTAAKHNFVDELNRLSPATKAAMLGQTIQDLIANVNSLTTAYNGLVAKYNSLLAHMDAANVAALGTAHAANYGGSNSTVNVGALGSR